MLWKYTTESPIINEGPNLQTWPSSASIVLSGRGTSGVYPLDPKLGGSNFEVRNVVASKHASAALWQ